MPRKENEKKNGVSLVLCGAAGQGIQTVERILVRGLKRSGRHVFSTKEYMSRVRGGLNSAEIRVSSERVSAYCGRIDILVPFHPGAVGHVKGRLDDRTIILGDKTKIGAESFEEENYFFNVPLTEMASEVGGNIYLNIVAAGVIMGIFRTDLDDLVSFIKDFFSHKNEEIIRKNQEAVRLGYAKGQALCEEQGLDYSLRPDPGSKDDMLVNGAEAVGIGALAGGCQFISSYPMSPSTGVLVFLSQKADVFGVIAEQAEDEISAINMALGASYAGARAMVTTSGGGFALMCEGISLAGMIETPVVVHIAQRPGPATGLPTRTEQADLELALYAGHGEFPRILFAPGDLEEAIRLTRKAFDLADRFQIPVFVLTDQYLMDSYTNIAPGRFPDKPVIKHIIKTSADYRRYELTENGLSPRGIPGWGEGLVGVDSDEHDEESHITEDLDLRTKMVDKRLKKGSLLRKEAIPPSLSGPRNFRKLIIGWGSNAPVVREALGRMGRQDLSFLHFSQVYPLSEQAAEIIRKAEQAAVIENNATAQLGKLLRLETGIDITEKILKYSGLPFSVEEVVDRLESLGF